MEKLQQVLKFLRQYGFWIVCVLATLGTAGVWFWGAGVLNGETVTNRNALKGRIKQIDTIASEISHPNPASETQLAAIIAVREDKLYQAWEMLARKQDGTLTWPEKFKSEYPDLYEDVSGMRPIEAFKGVEIEKRFLTLYRDYHRDLFKPLTDKIGAKWNQGVSGGTVATLDRDVGNVIVDWHPKNQSNILRDHFTWDNGAIPSTQQMLYAQEDYWVLDSIMDTIKRVNGDIESRHKAAIKTIEYIRLGKTVEPRAGTVKIKTSGGIVTEETTLAKEAAVSAPTPRGRAGEAEVTVLADAAENRYVDLEYKPLSAAMLEASMKGAKVKDARISVAKRMPVQMRLLINQSKINDFQVECGNSNLPIEIRQVRLGRFGRGGVEMASGGGSDTDVSKADVWVELFGIVYIFNPPNKDLLNIKEPANQATAMNR
jgi:hypothetical protein